MANFYGKQPLIYMPRRKKSSDGTSPTPPTPPIPTTYRTWPVNALSQGYSLNDYTLYLLMNTNNAGFNYTLDYEGAPAVGFTEFLQPHTAVEMDFYNIKNYLDNYGGFTAWPNFVNRGIRTGVSGSRLANPTSVYVMYIDNGVFVFERWYNGSQGSDFNLSIQKTNGSTTINNKTVVFPYYELYPGNTGTTIADKSHFQDLIDNYSIGMILFTSMSWTNYENTIRGLFREHLAASAAMTVQLNEMILQ